MNMDLYVKYEKALESDKHLKFCDLKEDLKNSVRLWVGARSSYFTDFSNRIR